MFSFDYLQLKSSSEFGGTNSTLTIQPAYLEWSFSLFLPYFRIISLSCLLSLGSRFNHPQSFASLRSILLIVPFPTTWINLNICFSTPGSLSISKSNVRWLIPLNLFIIATSVRLLVFFRSLLIHFYRVLFLVSHGVVPNFYYSLAPTLSLLLFYFY